MHWSRKPADGAIPSRGFESPPLRSAPNPQVVSPLDGRELWREQSIFGSVEPNGNGLENRCASYWRTESSNLSPSIAEPNLTPLQGFSCVSGLLGQPCRSAGWGSRGLLRGAGYPIPTPGGAVESAIASHSVAAL